MTARADNADEASAWRLAELLAQRGDLEALTARAIDLILVPLKGWDATNDPGACAHLRG